MPDQRPRQDSSRDLLEELEDGWARTPSVSSVATASTDEAPDDRPSTPDVASLDEGWLDQLFPEDDDKEEDEDEPEEELPDERADPVAYAVAKKAQAERAAAKKDRKKAKLDAKRVRQRAKAVAMRQKQKGKKRKAAPAPSPLSRGQEKKEARKKARELDEREALADDADEVVAEVTEKPKRRAVAVKRAPSTTQSIKLLAIVLAVLLAIAAAVAVLSK